MGNILKSNQLSETPFRKKVLFIFFNPKEAILLSVIERYRHQEFTQTALNSLGKRICFFIVIIGTMFTATFTTKASF